MLFLCGMMSDTGEITTMTAFTYRYKPNEAKSLIVYNTDIDDFRALPLNEAVIQKLLGQSEENTTTFANYNIGRDPFAYVSEHSVVFTPKSYAHRDKGYVSKDLIDNAYKCSNVLKLAGIHMRFAGEMATNRQMGHLELADITLPKEVPTLILPEGITSIAVSFPHCNIGHLILPQTCSSIIPETFTIRCRIKVLEAQACMMGYHSVLHNPFEEANVGQAILHKGLYGLFDTMFGNSPMAIDLSGANYLEVITGLPSQAAFIGSYTIPSIICSVRPRGSEDARAHKSEVILAKLTSYAKYYKRELRVLHIGHTDTSMQWFKVHRDGTYSIHTIDKQSLISL